MRNYISIFWIFFKMSAVTFGGGYAMLPILEREIVEKRGWLSQEKIVDYYAISQGLPGIIAVNVAIFIGKEKKGVLGGVFAALGIVAPCLIIITLIATFLKNIEDQLIVRNAFAGISIGVSALILDAVIKLWKKAVVNRLGLVIFGIIFLAMIFTTISPVVFIAFASLAGLLSAKFTKGDSK